MTQWLAGRYFPAALVVAGLAVFAASPALAGVDRVTASGRVTGFAAAVPADASARVEAVYDTSGSSTITLYVRGMQPRKAYGAHAHANPCGREPRDAGPDFQIAPNPDPEAPHDPAYENQANEIWLDFKTDETGNAVATTTVAWQFSPERRAGSVMIHAEPTNPGPRDAGEAGARIACLSVGF